MQIAEAIEDAIKEAWPNLKIKTDTVNNFSLTPRRGQPLGDVYTSIRIEYPVPSTNSFIWVGTVIIENGLTIKLNVLPSTDGVQVSSYENELSDPKSLDELYTYLHAHIGDVHSMLIDKNAGPPTTVGVNTKLPLRRWGE